MLTALDLFSSLVIGPFYTHIILGLAGLNSILMIVQLTLQLGTETIMKYWIIIFLSVEFTIAVVGVIYLLATLRKNKGDL